MRRTLATLMLCALAACTTAEAAPTKKARPPRVPVPQASVVDPIEEARQVYAALRYVADVRVAEAEVGIAAAWAEFAAWVESLRPPPPPPPPVLQTATATAGGFPSDAWWWKVAQCEEGGAHGIAWNTHASNRVGTFVGGLGILEQAWNETVVRALGYYVAGWVASPAEQITVARALYQRVGAGAWTSGSCSGPPY